MISLRRIRAASAHATSATSPRRFRSPSADAHGRARELRAAPSPGPGLRQRPALGSAARAGQGGFKQLEEASLYGDVGEFGREPLRRGLGDALAQIA